MPRADKPRCPWAGDDPDMVRYHDEEWGVPVHDRRALFELLTLEGAQAGLSWSTVLHKREGYRRAFAGFDPVKVARFDAARLDRLMGDASIVRNRAKLESTVGNARALLTIERELGSFDEFVWSFVEGRRPAKRRQLTDVPASTPESDALSKALKARGFKFVGTTICYAFMRPPGSSTTI